MAKYKAAVWLSDETLVDLLKVTAKSRQQSMSALTTDALRRVLMEESEAADEHMDINYFDGIVSTTRHLAGRTLPVMKAEMYRIEAFTDDIAPMPIHAYVYYVPGNQLDEVLSDWSERGERVVDIRPMTATDARTEIEEFRERIKR